MSKWVVVFPEGKAVANLDIAPHLPEIIFCACFPFIPLIGYLKNIVGQLIFVMAFIRHIPIFFGMHSSIPILCAISIAGYIFSSITHCSLTRGIGLVAPAFFLS